MLEGSFRRGDLAAGNAPGGDVLHGFGEVPVGVGEGPADDDLLHGHPVQAERYRIAWESRDREPPRNRQQFDSER
jgi:hypothetical protein